MTINRRFLGKNPSAYKVADTNDFPKERFEDSDWVGYSTDKNRRVTEQLHARNYAVVEVWNKRRLARDTQESMTKDPIPKGKLERDKPLQQANLCLKIKQKPRQVGLLW